MASWMERLKASPTAWLLEKACPPIQYRTLTEILGRPYNDPEATRAREGASNYKPAVTISRTQKETGTWLDKVLEFEAPNTSRNRGPGLVNQYLALVDYAWDQTHPIIHCSAELLLRFVVQDPHVDLFELKGYAGANAEVDRSIRRTLAAIAAALLSRSGYADHPEVRSCAERILGELEEQYPPDGPPDLYESVVEIEEEGSYRLIREGRHVPDMFLYYLLGWSPVFATPRGRAVASRVTRNLMAEDPIRKRIRGSCGKRYLKLRDLPVGSWTREEFAAGRLGYLLHDLELLARTGTLLGQPRAVERLEWLLSLQHDDGVFRVDAEIEKVVSPSQYHYFPLEDSWRGKHKKYTDVTFRTLLILTLLDRG